MSITFGQGISIGSGISYVPPELGNGLAYDPAYIGSMLALEQANLNVYDGGPGQYTALTNRALSLGVKYMISWCLTYTTDPANLVGLATRSANLESYLGSDANSIGFAQDGTLYYNGSAGTTGLPTWGSQGDCIDLAVDALHGFMWLRVNGGDWNGSPTANPATNVGGVAVPSDTLVYPAVTIGGYGGPSELGINSAPIYSVPVGFTFVDTGWPAFVVLPTLGTSSGSFDGSFSFVDTTGYTLDSPSDAYAAYYINCPPDQTAIINAFAAAGMTGGGGYMWYTNWGPGSSDGSYGGGVSHVGYYNNSPDAQLYIVAFDPASNWQDPGPYGSALPGTFKFPVVCTAIIPTIEKSGWC